MSQKYKFQTYKQTDNEEVTIASGTEVTITKVPFKAKDANRANKVLSALIKNKSAGKTKSPCYITYPVKTVEVP